MHPDHHIRFGNALYSVPTEYIGKELALRADSKLMRLYHEGVVIKTPPVMAEASALPLMRTIRSTRQDMR